MTDDEGKRALEAAEEAHALAYGTGGDPMREAIRAYLAALPNHKLQPIYPTDAMWACLGSATWSERKEWEGDFGNFAALLQDIASAAPPPPCLGDSDSDSDSEGEG